MFKRTKLYIGTSGWTYDDWGNGVFYPADIKSKKRLEFYGHAFNTVEVNSSFYKQLSSSVFLSWKGFVPDDFVFSVKMNRFLTHVKRLNEPQKTWDKFINSANNLEKKLGPILLQLPPSFKINTKKLLHLLNIVPRKYKVALEVRNDSWFCEEVYDILRKNNCSLVFADTADRPLEKQKEIITADFIYVRMHGPSGLYTSKYNIKKLKNLASRIDTWKKTVKEIFIYFNNDTKGYATTNAKQLNSFIF